MGQYFMWVNVDKKEYVCPWCIGGVAKLWEWCANHEIGVIGFLMRKSDQIDGGDIRKYEYAGRWAFDRVALVGDYDSSNLYWTARETFKNISPEVAKEYNDFIEIEEMKLAVGYCSFHSETHKPQYEYEPKTTHAINPDTVITAANFSENTKITSKRK